MDKIFQEKFEHYSPEPTDRVWDGIRQQLITRKRDRRMTFFKFAAAASFLLFAFLAGWYFYDVQDSTIQQPVAGERTLLNSAGNTEEEGMAGRNDMEILRKKPEKKQAIKVPSGENLVRVASVTEKKQVQEKTIENASRFSADNVFCQALDSKKAILSLKENSRLLAGTNKKTGYAGIQEALGMQQDKKKYRKQEIKKGRGWRLGFIVSPGYSSYSASHSGNYINNMTYSSSKGNRNISGGLSLMYKTGEKWSLESGIYYTRNGQKAGSIPGIFAGPDGGQRNSATEKLYFNAAVDVAENRMSIKSTAGIIDFNAIPRGAEVASNIENTGGYSGALITSGELSQVFDFLEIPLCLRYRMIDSRLDVEVTGGINAGFIVGNSAYLRNEYGKQYIGKTRDIARMNVSGTFGMGIVYPLSKQISFAVEPRINYYLNSINRNSDVRYQPFRVGFSTGIYYAFN